jgi:hypothetical protein
MEALRMQCGHRGILLLRTRIKAEGQPGKKVKASAEKLAWFLTTNKVEDFELA